MARKASSLRCNRVSGCDHCSTVAIEDLPELEHPLRTSTKPGGVVGGRGMVRMSVIERLIGPVRCTPGWPQCVWGCEPRLVRVRWCRSCRSGPVPFRTHHRHGAQQPQSLVCIEPLVGFFTLRSERDKTDSIGSDMSGLAALGPLNDIFTHIVYSGADVFETRLLDDSG